MSTGWRLGQGGQPNEGQGQVVKSGPDVMPAA
jgi:hypothetical protein